jgi:hypothetical protein
LPSVQYEIVEHDGGWAYRAGGTYSETYPTHDAARAAAERAASEQRAPEDGERGISFEDEAGVWKDELADGRDRPATDVKG